MAETLLQEPNVELFDFQARFDWVENYDLYYDLIHYVSVVNDEMAHAMSDGVCRINDIDPPAYMLTNVSHNTLFSFRQAIGKQIGKNIARI